MPDFSPACFVVANLLLMLLVATGPFRRADLAPTREDHRVSTLDGLRGFLALSVVFHHASIYQEYLRDGVWTLPPSRFFAMLGGVGVAVFFMITGFLFWQKMLAERGRLRWSSLYLGRVFRIGPLYLVAIGAMIVIALTASGWRLHGTAFGLVKTCAWWLSLGIFGPAGDIDHYAATDHVLAGVTWTLQYEWYFYASLLPLAFLARYRTFALAFPPCAFAAVAIYDIAFPTEIIATPPLVCAALFLAGMSTACLRAVSPGPSAPDVLVSVTVVLLVVATFLAFSSAHAIGAVALLAAAFALIASGSSVFGLLTTPSARRLGDMSYGIYLLHGLVLTIVFAVAPVRAFALTSPFRFWATIMICAVIVVMIATVTLVTVERPGVALGRRVDRAIREMLAVRRGLLGRKLAARRPFG